MSTPTPGGGTTPSGHDPYAQQHQTYGDGQSTQNPYGQTMPSYDQNTPGQQYGQPAYGQGQYGAQGQYGQPAHGQSPYQQGGTAQMPQAIPFASYGSRVAAYLLDGLFSLIPLFVLGGLGLWLALKDTQEVPANDPYDPTATTVEGFNASGFVLMGLSFLVFLLFQAWNRGARQGRTGQSLGKKIANIQVVDERTGQPAGTGAGLGRFGIEFVFGIVNSFVGVLSLIDLLWPLWDVKKQTLHDKVVHTVVVGKTHA